MPTIVTGTIPASDLALSHSLKTLPDLRFEVEQVVSSGDGVLMPMLWVRGNSREKVKATLEEDPSVDDVTLLGDYGEEWLFRMRWVGRVEILFEMLTNSEATILDAFGHGNQWKLRVLYPRRSLFSKTHEFCEEHGPNFEVSAIRELDEEPVGRYGLTSAQYEILFEAWRQGYFEVPRAVNLTDLSDQTDISHQAVSERLRRATESLVKNTLFVEFNAPS